MQNPLKKQASTPLLACKNFSWKRNWSSSKGRSTEYRSWRSVLRRNSIARKQCPLHQELKVVFLERPGHRNRVKENTIWRTMIRNHCKCAVPSKLMKIEFTPQQVKKKKIKICPCNQTFNLPEKFTRLRWKKETWGISYLECMIIWMQQQGVQRLIFFSV